MMYTTTKKRGFTLVETLFYVGGLVLLLFVISTLLIYMFDWYKTVTIDPRVDQVGISIVDKLVKDIHASRVVNTSQSLFDNSNGYISMTGSVNLIDVTKKYAISNGCITYQKDGGAISCISPSGMTVTNFNLQKIDSPLSSAVRFNIDISYQKKNATTTRTYSGFAILRQSYE